MSDKQDIDQISEEAAADILFEREYPDGWAAIIKAACEKATEELREDLARVKAINDDCQARYAKLCDQFRESQPKGEPWTVDKIYAVWDSMNYDDDYRPPRRFAERLSDVINARIGADRVNKKDVTDWHDDPNEVEAHRQFSEDVKSVQSSDAGQASEQEISDEDIRKAVEADIQQWLTNSLTPQRSYLMPIDNIKKLLSHRPTPAAEGKQI